MNAICPPKNKLKSLSLGLLSDDESGVLFEHLENCENCQQQIQVDDPADDTLINQIKTSTTVESAVDFEDESECKIAGFRALAALGADPNEASNSALEFPDQIGDYEIVRPLGRGGMGQVFLGRHTKLERPVAVKCIAGHRLLDDSAHERFTAEMKIIGSLSHPNIVQAFDARESDGMAVLVTEFIDGLNVNEIVKRTGALNVDDACQIVGEVCKALDYVDSKGMIHRDVKPSNIMIDKDGQVKLLDLGLARLQSTENGLELTATGQAIGTVDYVSPEQIDGSRNVDLRSDIYSLGCTLYKLLTGKAPFEAPGYSTTLAKLNAHANETPQSIGDIVDVPVKLRKLLERMLQKQPDKRPQSYDEIQAVLRSLAESSDLQQLAAAAIKSDSANVKPAIETAAGKKPQSQRRSPWVAAIASGLVGILLGALMGITITVEKPNGETASIVIPDRATAVVDADGNVHVELPDGQSRTIESSRVTGSKIADSEAGSAFNRNARSNPGRFEFVTEDPGLDHAEIGDLVDLFQEPSWSKKTGLIRRNLIAGSKPIVSIEPETSDGQLTGKKLVSIALDDQESSALSAAKERDSLVRLIGYTDGNHSLHETAKLEGAYRVESLLVNKAFQPSGGACTVIRMNEYSIELLMVDPNGFVRKSGDMSVLRRGRLQMVVDNSEHHDNAASDQSLLAGIYEFGQEGKLRIGLTPGGIEKRLTFEDVIQELRLERIVEPKTDIESQAISLISNADNDFRIAVHRAVTAGNGPVPEEHSEIEMPVYSSGKQKLWVRDDPFLANKYIHRLSYVNGTVALNLTPAGSERMWAEFHGHSEDFFLVTKINGEATSASKTVGMNFRRDHAWSRGIQIGAGLERQTLENWIKQFNDGLQIAQERPQQPTDEFKKIRQLSLASLNYEAANTHFPASRNTIKKADGDSKPFSWRVAILPYIDRQDLYAEYRFDEDWDSEHNKKLLARMPDLYRHESAAKDATTTWYVGFADKKSALGIDRGVSLMNFKDGTSGTLLLVETDSGIPWTKPADLPFTDKAITAAIKKSPAEKAGIRIARADGFAEFLAERKAKQILRKMITRSGGELIQVD